MPSRTSLHSARSRVAVRILSANANSQCTASAYGGYSAFGESRTTQSAFVEPHLPSSAPVELCSPSSAFASTVSSVSAVASSPVYCYEVALRAAQVQENFGLLRLAIVNDNSPNAHALLAMSWHVAITRVQGIEEHLNKRIRM